jgi:uncharacterized membrane protein YbhN (UPF0104 family)
VTVCRNHNLVLSSFTTYHRVCNKRNTTGATCGAGTAYPSGALESPHPVFSGVRVARSLVFCVLFCRSVFVILFLVIILSVLLRFTASDYLFGIFKLRSTRTLADASRVHPFCNLQSRSRTHAGLVIGLYEFLGDPTT